MSNEARSLKDALYKTIHNCKLPIEALAEEVGMAASYLYRSALPDPDTDGTDASGVRFPLKKVIPLIRATGDFQVMDYLERTLGRVAVVVKADGEKSTAALANQAIFAAAEFGDLMREINHSLGDGKLTQDERDRIQVEGWEAVIAIVQLLKSCEGGRCG